MDLQPVRDTHGQMVNCAGCNSWVLLTDTYADLDGLAFEAYYCRQCVVRIESEKR